MILSARRLGKFSKQVETAEKNLFNDRLSRAIEHMQNEDSLHTRIGGVSILQSLALASDANSEDRSIIIDILNSFIRQRATPPQNAIFEEKKYNYYDWLEAKPREKRKDIELAIVALSKIVPSDGLENRQMRDIQLNRLDLRGLEFKNLNFSSINFEYSNLENTIFLDCFFDLSLLWHVNLRKAQFVYSNFSNTSFQQANLENIRFTNCDFLNNCSFVQANLTRAYFDLAQSFEIILSNTDVSGANFQLDFDFPELAAGRLIYDCELSPNFGVMSSEELGGNIESLAKNGEYTWKYIHGEWKRELKDNSGQYANGRAWWYHHLSREQSPTTYNT